MRHYRGRKVINQRCYPEWSPLKAENPKDLVVSKKDLMKLLWVSIIILLLNITLAFSAFRDYVVSARVAGLCGAFTAIADDSIAAFYNPAGLAQINQPEIISTYGKLYLKAFDDDTNLTEGAFSISYPMKQGTVNCSIRYFSLSWLYNERIIGLFYSRKMSSMFYTGAGLKILNLSYGSDEYTAINPLFENGSGKTSIGFDVGVMSYMSQNIVIAGRIENVNQPNIGIKYNDIVPIKFTIASAYRKKTLNISSEIYFQEKDRIFLAGIEKTLFKFFNIRTGVGLGNRSFSRLALGAGYEKDNIAVDWGCYFPLGVMQGTLGSHIFSLKYKFGVTSSEDVQRIEKIYDEFVDKVEQGEYELALDAINRVLTVSLYDKRYKQKFYQISNVTRYIKQAKGTEKYNVNLRRGINKYIFEDKPDKAINFLLYAMTTTSNKDKKSAIDKLIRFIAKETGVTVMEIPSGWTLVQYMLHQALEFFSNDQYDECIKLCQQVLELEENNVTALKRLGSSYYMLGDTQRAKKVWLQSIKLAPKDEENIKIKEILDKLE